MLRITGDSEAHWEIEREFEDDRLEILRLLHEACEVEHSLLLQYLYAAYSLREGYGRVLGDAGPNRPSGLLGIAFEEMHHLRDVNRILVELGGHPNLTRQDFPYQPEIYPFPLELERLSRHSVAKYLYAEAPAGALDPEGSDPELAMEVAEALREDGRPGTREAPINRIGSLYRTVIHRMEQLAARGPAPQVPGWISVLERVQREGEEDHFEFFRSLFRGEAFGAGPEIWSDPASPAYPSEAVATNPTVEEGHPGSLGGDDRTLGEIGNRAYWAAVMLLDAAYREPGLVASRSALEVSARLMSDAIQPVARRLAARGEGMPFDPLGLGYSPHPDRSSNLESAARFLREGAERVAGLPPGLHRDLDPVRAAMDEAEQELRGLAYRGSPVAVVGAGPAGLAAAFALAERGLPVRLLEIAPVVGGKVYSERTPDADGVLRSVEHGVHGWWPAYLNFYALLERSGVDVDAAFVDAGGTDLVYEPGKSARLEPFPLPLRPPLFLLGHLTRAHYLGGPSTLLRMARFGVHTLAFDHRRDYAKYDELSLAEFLEREGVPELVGERLLRPFALNLSYLMPDRLSAAAMLSSLQFYMLPAHDALVPRWSRGLPEDRIFGPLVDGIRSRGGHVEMGRAVLSVDVRQGGVRGVVFGDMGTGADGEVVEVARIPVAQVPEGDFLEVPTPDGGRVYVRSEAGAYQTILPICSHQGGDLVWEGETRSFRCTTHGGRFDGAGGRVSGLPPGNLPAQPAPERVGDELVIRVRRKRGRLACRDVVLATDVAAARKILEKSPGVPAGLRSKLAELKTTPVLVVRMWFPRGTELGPNAPATAVTQACELVDNYFHLNHFDSSYHAEGEVIEVQGARMNDKWSAMPDEEVVDWVLRDLKSVRVLHDDLPAPEHFAVLRHPGLFTSYEPGQARHRPEARSEVAGLYFAGDWTRADWSAWFMERAVISGLRAANEVLEDRGLEPYPIERLPREGGLMRISRFAARWLRAGQELWRSVHGSRRNGGAGGGG